ncbi:substrate-binding domain-containing protein [Agarivorans sp. MS3-6]
MTFIRFCITLLLLISSFTWSASSQRLLVEPELVEPVIRLIKQANIAPHLGIIKTATVAQHFIEGKGQIGISSQRWLDSEMASFTQRYGYQPTELFFSSDAAAIMVHPDNPLNAIDMQTLGKVFSCRNSELNYHWHDLVVSLSEDLGQVKPFAVTNELAQHRQFSELVACDNGADSNAVQLSRSQLSETLNSQPAAIAYTLYASDYQGAKALQLIDKQGEYFDLNHQTILSGRYPLANVYYLYLNLPPQGHYSHPAYKQFIQYAQTEDAQQVLSQFGFIPLPEEALHRNLVTLGQISPEISGGYK